MVRSRKPTESGLRWADWIQAASVVKPAEKNGERRMSVGWKAGRILAALKKCLVGPEPTGRSALGGLSDVDVASRRGVSWQLHKTRQSLARSCQSVWLLRTKTQKNVPRPTACPLSSETSYKSSITYARHAHFSATIQDTSHKVSLHALHLCRGSPHVLPRKFVKNEIEKHIMVIDSRNAMVPIVKKLVSSMRSDDDDDESREKTPYDEDDSPVCHCSMRTHCTSKERKIVEHFDPVVYETEYGLLRADGVLAILTVMAPDRELSSQRSMNEESIRVAITTSPPDPIRPTSHPKPWEGGVGTACFFVVWPLQSFVLNVLGVLLLIFIIISLSFRVLVRVVPTRLRDLGQAVTIIEHNCFFGIRLGLPEHIWPHRHIHAQRTLPSQLQTPQPARTRRASPVGT
ncbi:hypothetical protein PENSPDRAFT_670749 [Peniophora sp. CONT]|nr:hypothetical protein PENSPDRAFT_670749 [Peniophora sp. CONT]